LHSHTPFVVQDVQFGTLGAEAPQTQETFIIPCNMKEMLKGTAIPVACAIILAACSSSRLTSSWSATNASVIATSNKILVLGIIQEKDVRLRMQMEG
jgi:uncharacterized lipoprotein YajG